MNLGALIELKADFQDHYEYHMGITMIPKNHPPSLRKPKIVEQPTAQEGWRKRDSKAKKRRARRDLKLIMERTRRQSVKPVMVNHAKVPVFPDFYAPL